MSLLRRIWTWLIEAARVDPPEDEQMVERVLERAKADFPTEQRGPLQ